MEVKLHLTWELQIGRLWDGERVQSAECLPCRHGHLSSDPHGGGAEKPGNGSEPLGPQLLENADSWVPGARPLTSLTSK